MNVRNVTSWLFEMAKMNMFPRFPGQDNSAGKKDDTKEGSGVFFGMGDERDMSAISSFLQGENRKIFTEFVARLKKEDPGKLNTIMQVFSVRVQEDNRAKKENQLGADGTIMKKILEVCAEAVVAKNKGGDWFAVMQEGFAIESINSRDLVVSVVLAHARSLGNVMDNMIASSDQDSLIRKLDCMGEEIRAGTYNPEQSDIPLVKALNKYNAERKKRHARAAQWWNPF